MSINIEGFIEDVPTRTSNGTQPAKVREATSDCEIAQLKELTTQEASDALAQEQAGDAEIFRRIHDGTALFNSYRDAWHHYKDGVWEADDLSTTRWRFKESIVPVHEGLHAALYKQLGAHELKHGKVAKDTDLHNGREVIRAKIKETRRRIAKLQQNDWMTSVMTWAEQNPLLVVRPQEFDALPHLLACSNTVLDFAKCETTAFSSGHKLSNRINIPFDPAALCPKWDEFLLRIMDGDTDMIEYLARVVGYCLTGYTSEDMIAFFYGQGANGKSTFCKVIEMLLGSFCCRMDISILLASNQQNASVDYKKAALVGKRLMVTDEIPAGRRLDESTAKALTGGDKITARNPYEKPFEFEPSHKIIMIGNHKPEIEGVDHGIWRRLHLIPFTVTIPESERRSREDILAEMRVELPGILQWAWRGWLDYKTRGRLAPPERVIKATADYRTDSDQISHFLSDSTTADNTACAKVKDLWDAYKNWTDDNKERRQCGTNHKFTLRLRELLRDRVRDAGGRMKVVDGMRLE